MNFRITPATAELLESRIAPANAGAVELSAIAGTNGFILHGAAAYDSSGWSVSEIGDINGDGIGDVATGAIYASENGTSTGAAYVIFGSSNSFASELSLAQLNGGNGFKLSGVASADNTGNSVRGAGDVNGDGLDDLIIGAYYADPHGDRSGATYVVFGSTTAFSSNLQLSALDGTTGFKLSGESAINVSGYAASGIGDFNGDGIDDIVIGAPGRGQNRGVAYLVFGHTAAFGSNIDLSSLNGTSGFILNGNQTYDRTGISIGRAGDVNDDGFDDLIVGASTAGGYSGAAYVVFGQSGPFNSSMELSALNGSTGFKMQGQPGDLFGISTSGAGDVNGDGFDDLIIGADGQKNYTGAAFVVFGKSSFGSSLVLSSLNGASGFKITGEHPKTATAFSVRSAGDLDGDGFDDLIMGAPTAKEHGKNSGAAYVVYGRESFASTLSLKNLDGFNGFKIRGEHAGDFAGDTVSGAGDVNDDEFDDLIIGADGTDVNGKDSGSTYVIFGGPASPPAIANGHKITYTDVDGDHVTVKITKGDLADALLQFRTEGFGGQLEKIDFGSDSQFAGTKVNVTVKKGPVGNGTADIGSIDAGVDLTSISTKGDLGRVTAGDATTSTPGLKTLKAGSMGVQGLDTQDIFGSLISNITGALKTLKIAHDFDDATLNTSGGVDGSIKTIKVGEMYAGTASAGIFASGQIGSITVNEINGTLNDPFTISAVGVISPTTAAQALAIKSLTIKGNATFANIMAGSGTNPDAQIGSVLVQGDWKGSSIAAGASTGGDIFFGDGNDSFPAGGSAAFAARIASIVINGTAEGTPSGESASDHYGFDAQEIGSLKIGGTAIPAVDNATLGTTGDFNIRIFPA